MEHLTSRQRKAYERGNALAAQRGVDNSATAMQERMTRREGIAYFKTLAGSTQKGHARMISLLRLFLIEAGLEPGEFLGKAGGAKPLTLMHWQEYARWLASRSTGRLKTIMEGDDESQVIKQSTLIDYLHKTLSAKSRLNAKRDQLSSADSECLTAYVQTELTQEFQLSIDAKPKLMPTSMDFKAVLFACYSEQMPFRCAEHRLGFTLFLKLLVYSASRPGELSLPAAYRHEPDSIRWSDIRLMHVSLSGGRRTIAAIVRIRLLKGKRLNSCFKEQLLLLDKQSPLLCPLVDIMAIAESQGVLRHPAKDLLALTDLSPSTEPPGTMQPIKLHDWAAEQFVMRKFAIKEHDIERTAMPATYHSLHRLNEAACIHAGIFCYKTPYMWRRLAANSLNASGCTEEDRKLLMGHNLFSKVFGAYISQLSRVDIQGLLRDGEQQTEAFEHAKRISRQYKLPSCLSVTGRKAVLARDDILQLRTALDDARAAFYDKNLGLSIDAGCQLCLPEAMKAKELQQDYKVLVSRELKRAFGVELRANMQLADEQLGDRLIEQLYQATVEASCLSSDDDEGGSAGVDGAMALHALGDIDLADVGAAQEAIMQRDKRGQNNEADSDVDNYSDMLFDELLQDTRQSDASAQEWLDDEQGKGMEPPPLFASEPADKAISKPKGRLALQPLDVNRMQPASNEKQFGQASSSFRRVACHDHLHTLGATDERTIVAGSDMHVRINAFGKDRCSCCKKFQVEPCVLRIFETQNGNKQKVIRCDGCFTKGRNAGMCDYCMPVVEKHWPEVAAIQNGKRSNQKRSLICLREPSRQPTPYGQSVGIASLEHLANEHSVSTADIQALPTVQSEQKQNKLTQIMSANFHQQGKSEQQISSAELVQLLMDDRLLFDKLASTPGVRLPLDQHPIGVCLYCGKSNLGKRPETHRRQCAAQKAAEEWLDSNPVQLQVLENMKHCPVEHERRLYKSTNACHRLDFDKATAEEKCFHLSAHLTSTRVVEGTRVMDARCMVSRCSKVCNSVLEMRVHLDQAHHLLVPYTRQSKENFLKLSVAMQEIKHCTLCNIYLFGPCERRKHCIAHIIALLDKENQDEQINYAPIISNDAIVRPGLCMFCFHDNALPPEKRIFMFGGTQAWAHHCQQHFEQWLGGRKAQDSDDGKGKGNGAEGNDEAADDSEADEQGGGSEAEEQSERAESKAEDGEGVAHSVSTIHGKHICPLHACGQQFSSLRDYGNHFVELHRLPIFGSDKAQARTLAAYKQWNGRLDGLTYFSKIEARQAAQKAAGIKKKSTQYKRRLDAQSRFTSNKRMHQ
jgi:hypothetical protein